MSLHNLLKNNIIQDQKIAKFLLNEISAYQDNLRDDGLIESPDYEDWEFLYNYIEDIKSFPHVLEFPNDLYRDVLLINLEGELETYKEHLLEDYEINLEDYKNITINKTHSYKQLEKDLFNAVDSYFEVLQEVYCKQTKDCNCEYQKFTDIYNILKARIENHN